MRIKVKARPNSRENRVVAPPDKLFPDEERVYTVYVKELPVNNRANEAIVRELSIFFKCTKSQIKIISGANSRSKYFDIQI